jgi:23S rRNA pseudouridine1911/1915/1917 synthase
VHLTSIGHPLLGDPVYLGRSNASTRRTAGLTRQALHAMRLELDHPATNERMAWHSNLPADLRAALDELKRTSTHALA